MSSTKHSILRDFCKLVALKHPELTLSHERTYHINSDIWHMDHFPLIKVWKWDKLIFYNRDKKTTSRQVGETETQYLPKPHLWHTIGRNLTQLTLLPKEGGVDAPYHIPQPLGYALEGQAPKNLVCKTNGADVQGTKSTTGNQGFPFKGLTYSLICPKAQWENSSFKST